MMLDVENLSVYVPSGRFFKQLVRGISFQMAAGEILGVVGESGCGKSITNLALMGLLPTGARVHADRLMLCGQNLLTFGRNDWPTLRGHKAAMIFQNAMSALNPSFTVGMQLIESVRKAAPHASRQQWKVRAEALLDQVGIASAALRMRNYPHELSGGMAQRVMIAMSLACEPALLIADEPTTALDVTIQAQILELLSQIRRERGMAVILVSHDIGLVQQFADRIQVMYSGEIIETGPVQQVYTQPTHPYTRALLQALPGRQGVQPKTMLTTIPGVVPPIELEMEGCRFAPRCDRTLALCQKQPAPLQVNSANGAWSRCHF